MSFEVYPHEIFGFLGSNGAGKTTTIKCIMTLTKPSEGSIEVFGINALTDPDRVRQNIGYVPQSLSLVSELSGYENLLIYSKLYGVPKDKRNKNISHILELLGISERADDEVRKYSGGMMRRLEIGTAIVHNPPLIILDEPTIGLDPKGRHTVWDVLRRLVNELGTTIFMTTHDMSEADELCDRIAIINHGKISVIDTPSNLKRSVVGQEGEGQVVIIKTLDPVVAVSVLDRELGSKAQITDNRSLRIVMKDVESSFSALITTLVRAGIEVESLNVQKPTLDDVFLKYAGTRTNESESQEEGWKNIRDVRRTFRQMG
ncbi:MAG TPA: ABC transporter ATP-binding protein [Candidatus Bathyarchaeia archaeon]|nr:ABC transporter ATP-binding protein [Candidatus Bathyarchaeia archaeon]